MSSMWPFLNLKLFVSWFWAKQYITIQPHEAWLLQTTGIQLLLFNFLHGHPPPQLPPPPPNPPGWTDRVRMRPLIITPCNSLPPSARNRLLRHCFGWKSSEFKISGLVFINPNHALICNKHCKVLALHLVEFLFRFWENSWVFTLPSLRSFISDGLWMILIGVRDFSKMMFACPESPA